MESIKKGLCSTCAFDATCTYARNFPVCQCEEFADHKPPFRALITPEGKIEFGLAEEADIESVGLKKGAFTLEDVRKRLCFN
jgi:hypothetical protein